MPKENENMAAPDPRGGKYEKTRGWERDFNLAVGWFCVSMSVFFLVLLIFYRG